jgi:hypothetical protein
MKRALLVAAAALALTACATAPANEGKGLAAAQDAVAAAVQGVHQAYASGLITKAQAQKADALVDQADDASRAARIAYAAGDSTTYVGAIAQLTTLATEIVALEKPQ